jgi:carbon storage regulator
MLVLSRKVGERISIGDQICITIVRVQGQTVRVGVEAPPNMAIVRDELVEGTKKQASANESAAATAR